MTESVSCVRRPAVAGYFYPADPIELGRQVDAFARRATSRQSALGVLVPHGSYRHAGAIAGETLGRVTIPRRCVILGPSHTEHWMPWSLMGSGAYRTPLGEIPVDASFASALRMRCPFLTPDAWAHRGEHAIEVLLPFLQRLGPPDLTIVPMIISADDPTAFAQLAQALAQLIQMSEEPILLVASSDLSHYETHAHAAAQDRAFLDAICALDSERLIRCVQDDGVIMCGYGAVACLLDATKALGASHGRLVRYGTSTDAGGDPHAVIGYAGVIVS